MMRLVPTTGVAAILAVLSLSCVVKAIGSVQVFQGGGEEDPLFEEHLFPLDSSSINETNYRRLSHYGGYRPKLTRTLSWPECKGMTAQDCKDYIVNYIYGRYQGHAVKNLQVLVKQLRSEPLSNHNAYYYLVPSNQEVIGQNSCTERQNVVSLYNNGGIWTYANGTTYDIPNLDCFGKTNAECCDIIWEHGEWMGLDKDGKHLTCYVYQEPTYPFFNSQPNKLLYPDKYHDGDGYNSPCKVKHYRVGPLKRQYQLVANKIFEDVVQMINNLFEYVRLEGNCVDRHGEKPEKGFTILLYRRHSVPETRFQKECLQRCIDYETETGVELTGCEVSHFCIGHTAKVVRGRDATIAPYLHRNRDRRRNNVHCVIDPVRSADTLKCEDLKFVIDNFYNFARMAHLNGLMGRVQFEYYHEECISKGNTELPITLGLKNLLFAIRDGVKYSEPIEENNVVYIMAGLDGIVADTPRIASINPALYPELSPF